MTYSGLFAVALVSIVFLPNRAAAEKCDARKTWEAMIDAKGGRERLHDVKVLYVHDWTSGWRFPAGRAARTERWALWVLPHYAWMRTTYADRRLGTGITTINYETGSVLTTLVPGQMSETNAKPIQPHYLYLVPETRWDKPEIVGCETASERGVSARRLSVRYGERLPITVFTLAIDRFLPMRITTSDGNWNVRYEKYESFNGIRMPTRISVDPAASRFFEASYEINPEYDPAFLEKKPVIEPNPEPWRPKR